MKKKTLIIIDGNALLHRAWHALPPLQTRDGQLVNAVYGFTMILFKVIRQIKPDYVVAAFDREEATFRHEEYEDYKAGREEQPDELYDQIPYLYDLLEAFGIPVLDKKGYEADDIIGTVVRDKDLSKKNVQSLILTGDLDALQLVDENTRVYTMKRGISDTVIYDPAKVEERYGLRPDQMIDYKALRGDPSDNIPGVKGIGEKTATKLLQEFGTLENLYKKLESEKGREEVVKVVKERLTGVLEESKKDAFDSKHLVTIVTDMKLKYKLDDAEWGGFDKERIKELFKEFQFMTLMDKLPEILGEKKGDQATRKLDNQKESVSKQGDLFSSGAATRHPEVLEGAEVDYEIVDKKAIKTFAERLSKRERFALEVAAHGDASFQSEIVGMGIHDGLKNFYVSGDLVKDLKEVLENKKIEKVGHDLKYTLEVLSGYDIKLQGIYFDTMLASYLLHSGSRGYDLKQLAFAETGMEIFEFEDIVEKKSTIADVKQGVLAKTATKRAQAAYAISKKLEKELDQADLEGIFAKMEVPLIQVLASMELYGVKLDSAFLQKLSKQAKKQLEKVEKEIYKLAGTEFNVNSPSQLKEILFDKLEISTKGIKKGKTGLSTAASELEKMKGSHPIIDLIFEHRELAKLISTYLDALPKLVNKETGRVHTSFNQTVAATGRLSSSNPNLQNIPIRTELGREVRKGFIAEKGYTLLAADYSQIELRIVASISKDPNMMHVFETGGDIHRTTAARINDVPLDKVTKQMRSAAKEINFGVIYGMGPGAMSQRTGLTRAQAKEFIDKYFKVYSNVALYMEGAKQFARDKGYVKTEFGRKRFLPDIKSGVPMVRAAAERMAINMPVQGLQADIVKLAMLEVYRYETGEKKKRGVEQGDFRMLLQVHDELVFEVKEDKVDVVAKLVKDTMEMVYKLNVPVVADVKVGKNWGEMKELN